MIGSRRETGNGALHNFPLPPKATIKVRPLRPKGLIKGVLAGSRARAIGEGTGMMPMPAISVLRLIKRWFPVYLDSWRDWRLMEEESTEAAAAHLRLRCLTMLSYLAVKSPRRVDRYMIFRMAETPVEELEAIYTENVRRLDPCDLGLPPFGLVREVEGSVLKWETNPARALAVLSRISGMVYTSGREPRIPDYTWPILPICLYHPLERKEESR